MLTMGYNPKDKHDLQNLSTVVYNPYAKKAYDLEKAFAEMHKLGLHTEWDLFHYVDIIGEFMSEQVASSGDDLERSNQSARLNRLKKFIRAIKEVSI